MKNVFLFLGNQTGIEWWISLQTAGNSLELIANPFSGLIEFSITVSSPVEAELSVYSLDGRLVVSRSLGGFVSGSNLFSEPAGDLPEGTYAICVRAGDELVRARAVRLL